MMLDKDQIEGWKEEPDEPEKAKVKRVAKPVASAAAPVEAGVEGAPRLSVPEPVITMTSQPDAPPPPSDVGPEAAPQRGGLAGALFDSREAVPTGEHVRITPEQMKLRKRRAMWTALALGGFAILIFLITLIKLGPQVILGRDL
jgi:hypothetical protein